MPQTSPAKAAGTTPWSQAGSGLCARSSTVTSEEPRPRLLHPEELHEEEPEHDGACRSRPRPSARTAACPRRRPLRDEQGESDGVSRPAAPGRRSRRRWREGPAPAGWRVRRHPASPPWRPVLGGQRAPARTRGRPIPPAGRRGSRQALRADLVGEAAVGDLPRRPIIGARQAKQDQAADDVLVHPGSAPVRRCETAFPLGRPHFAAPVSFRKVSEVSAKSLMNFT